MKVIPVPARDDNYAYLLVDTATNQAAAVDLYDVPKVQAAAQKVGIQNPDGCQHHRQPSLRL